MDFDLELFDKEKNTVWDDYVPIVEWSEEKVK